MLDHKIWHEEIGSLPILLDSLMGEFFKPEIRRLNKLLDDFIIENGKLTDTSTGAMMYKGKLYRHSALTGSPTKTIASHITLEPELERFFRDVGSVVGDRDRMRQFMFRLFSSANSFQEARDAVPDCIVSFLPKQLQISRYLQSHNFIFGSDERLKRQYEAFIPTIEMYAGFHYLY